MTNSVSEHISWCTANIDHQHYCSTSAPSLQQPQPQPQSQLGPRAENTKRTRTKRKKKPTTDKRRPQPQAQPSVPSPPSSSQPNHNNNNNIDCFRQFYLQRQSDGSLVIIPVVSNTIVSTTTIATADNNNNNSRREKESNNIGKPVRSSAASPSSSCRTASTAFDCTTTIQAGEDDSNNNSSLDTLTTRANYNPTTKSRRRKNNNNCYKSSKQSEDNFAAAKPNMQIGDCATDDNNSHQTTAADMVYDLSKQNSINLILQGGGKMMIDNNLGGDKQGQTFIGQMMLPANNITTTNNNNGGQYKPGTRAIINALKHDHPMAAVAPINVLTSPPPIVSSSTSNANNQGQQQQQLTNGETFLFDNTMAREQNFSSLPPVNTIFNDCLISSQPTMITANNASIQDSNNNNNCDLGRNGGGSFASATIIDDHHIDFYNHVDSTVDDEDETNLSYLPYGLYYHDDSKVLNQLISSPSLTSTNSTPVFEVFANTADAAAAAATNPTVATNAACSTAASAAAAPTTSSVATTSLNAPTTTATTTTTALQEVGELDKLDLAKMLYNDDQILPYSEVLDFDLDLSDEMDFICDENLFESTGDFGGCNNNNNNKENMLATSKFTDQAPPPPSRSNLVASNMFADGGYKSHGAMLDDGDAAAMLADSYLLTTDGGHKIMSPMSTKSEPTLAQLNSTGIKEGDNWMISSYGETGNNNTTARVSSAPVDIIAQQQQQQQQHYQQNIISSTSSPTMMRLTPSGQWFPATLNAAAGGLSSQSPNLNANVSSSDELVLMGDVGNDDISLEIQSILRQQQQQGLNHLPGQRQHLLNGSVIASPPQISSSLQHIKLAQSNQLAKPNFVVSGGQQLQQGRNKNNFGLLGKLLSNDITNDELLAPAGNSTPVMVATSYANNKGNLVQKNQMLNAVSSTAFNVNNKFYTRGGKALANCPTLQALITTNMNDQVINHNHNMSPMLGGSGGGAGMSYGLFGPINCNLTLGTVLNNNNNNNNRNRNNSMSTDYSASSHDEGFASQLDEESEESDGDNAGDNTSMEGLMQLVDNNNVDNTEVDMFFCQQQQQQQQQQVVATSNALNVTLVPSPIELNAGQQQQQQSNVSSPITIIKPEWSHHQPSQIVHVGDLSIYHQQQQQQQQQQQHLPTAATTASTSSVMDDNDGMMSSDDEFDDDESFYGDYDASDLIGATTSDDINNKWSLNMGRSRKGNEKRYFWQYNVQSKGPKGPRLGSVSSINDEEDPHVFREISDPVFAPDCQVEGVKHSGKARRGDGNDLTPNPKKLLMIGLELKKLSKTINDLTPVTDVPPTCRNNKRKEKNKLASRACRLKKKAQHEANKIKLCGLHREHAKLVRTINELRNITQLNSLGRVGSFAKIVTDVVESNKPKIEVSGNTAEFVNHILDNVSGGNISGGIEAI